MKTNHISEPQKLHFTGKEAFEEAYRIQEEKVKLLNQIENLMIRLSQYELSPKISKVNIQDTTRTHSNIEFKVYISSRSNFKWLYISFNRVVDSPNNPTVISFFFPDMTTGHLESFDKALNFLLEKWGESK